MSRYKCDPRWITIKFKGNAAFVAGVPIHPGRGFYYPEDRSLYWGEECGKAASREFSTRAFDEENNTSM